MRRSTNLLIISATFLLVSLASCKSRKAIELKESIVQKERVAFNILVDKKGLASQKLECLIKDDYKGALAFLDQEEQAFNKLIKEIETLPAEGIKQGNELKTAAVNYYTALKELQIFDRQEIAQREASSQSKGEELQVALNKILQLNIQKEGMYKKLYEKEQAFSKALEKFSAVNSI